MARSRLRVVEDNSSTPAGGAAAFDGPQSDAGAVFVAEMARQDGWRQRRFAGALLLALVFAQFGLQQLRLAPDVATAWRVAAVLLALALLAWRPVSGPRLPAAVWAVPVAALAAWPSAGAAPAMAHAWWPLVAFVVLALASVLAPVRGAGIAVLAAIPAAAAGGGPAAWWPAALAAAVGLALVWWQRRRWLQQTMDAWQRARESQALRQEYEAALRRDDDKSHFLAIASHDLRQPVHALGLFAATLHKRLADSAERALARDLLRSVDALERSFNAMLDISRLDCGAVSPRAQTFPLRDVFRRLHMQYGGQAELAGLVLRFSPGCKSVTSDPQLLERIVGNLVQNALRYTSSGGVVVVARSTSTHVNIEVWDSGPGISEQELPRIFQEFYQVGRSRRDRSQGLGMGLAIVKRLAALLGHRLEVVSEPGRGTMFRLGVRLDTLGEIGRDTAAADTQPMEPDNDAPRMVLVVDDEEPIREGLRQLLQEWGYQVMTAADAAQAEAAAVALEGRIDLLVSDLHLAHGIGGQELVAGVRRLCGRELPAILVTGDTAGQALREVAAGDDPVLFKPVQPRRLLETVRGLLQSQPAPSSSTRIHRSPD